MGLDLDRPLPIPFFLLSPLEQNLVPLVCKKKMEPLSPKMIFAKLG